MSHLSIPRLESRVAFPTTDWSLIRRMKAARSEDDSESRSRFFARYWQPVYGYFRSRGKQPEDAQDLTQDFMRCHFLESHKLRRFAPSRSRFRCWLIVCARNFMFDCDKRATAKKNRPEGGVIPLDRLMRAESRPMELVSCATPETAHEELWCRELLEKSLRRVRLYCLNRGRERDYDIFADYYLNTQSPRPTWKQLASRYRLPCWKAAANKADWVKGKLAEAVRQDIRQCVDHDDEVDEELRRLLA